MRSTYLLPVIFVIVLAACNSKPTVEDNKLGKIDFLVTGSDEALPYFNKGLLLLHSFEYKDAAEEFIKAREIDPGCVMAYWGEAMSYNHTLWSEQERDKAIAVLKLLGETEKERMARAPMEIEKDLLKGAGILYEFDEDKLIRDQAYAKYMELLNEKYEGHHEIASFYSLSLLGSVPEGRNVVVYEQAAEIAKKVLDENPEHPGALHYLIHSYDDPDHALLAVEAADKYSVVAPAAAHALHMPTHIYLALGMWEKVISSNIDSWEASKSRKARKGLDNNALGYHSYAWLVYGMLQKERFAEADSMIRDMITYTTELPSKTARSYLVRMKGAFLTETGDWTHELSEAEVHADDLRLETRMANNFIEGMKYYTSGDIDGLNNVIGRMNDELTKESGNLLIEGITVCSIPDAESQPATKLGLDQSRIMEMELRGLAAWMEMDTVETIRWLGEATDLEASISYSFGPPDVLKPSHELFGEWLLELNKPEEALVMFDMALTRAPGRMLSEKGKAEAMGRIKSLTMNN